MPGIRLGGGVAQVQGRDGGRPGGALVGTGSEVDLCRAFGWEVELHKFKVAMAVDLVALWHNGRIPCVLFAPGGSAHAAG